MLTLNKYVKPLSRFKTHWSFWTGSPVQMPDYIVKGRTVIYELSFHPETTPDQQADAIRFFEKSAAAQDQQSLQARYAALFARRSIAAQVWGLAVA